MSAPRPEPPRLPEIAPGTDACGCCEGTGPVTPQRVENRGGLGEIRYRIGTWADFRESLHAGLSTSRNAALRRLTTRADDDFSIGLLDAFACSADVLTFYQERIANESFLATARERISLQEMGRLIGYRLRPGLAAETLLAFTLETPPAPPAAARPEPGMFVTGVPATVRIERGLAVRSVPAPGETPQVFETVEAVDARPTWNAVRPWLSQALPPARGAVSTWLAGVNTRLKPGDALLFVGDEYFQDHDANQWDFRILDQVAADVAADRTFVGWRRPLGSVDPPKNPAAVPRAFALRRRAAIYGHNAPLWPTMPADFQTNYRAAFEPPGPVILKTAALVGKHDDWPRFLVTPAADDPAAAPAIDLDALYPEMPSGSFVVLAKGSFNNPAEPAPAGTYVELYTVTAVTEVSREEFALSGKVTRLGLSGANYAKFSSQVRETSVFGQSEPLPLAEIPVSTAIADDRVPVAISPDGLEAGRHLLVRGRRVRDGVGIVHAATLLSATPAGAGRSLLTITPPLPEPLLRDSVVVFANVALASHGETVSQVLGSGNAALPFQRFELKQLPLTWRAAANELGASPELTVRVDDIAWTVRDTLYGADARERALTWVDDEQGRRFVQFGDGISGARPSSGQNNVRATYRKGLGLAGNLAAESLTQLTQRPLGVKGVSNPLPGEGGADPEPAEEARQTMPLRTRTLGRAVSLLDYEDFARAFAGVAQAHASVLRLASGPVVAITIAGPRGVVISPASPVWTHLAAALAENGDPHVAVRLLAHRPRAFRLGLKIRRDPDHESTRVLAAVEAALRQQFAFENRALGAPVYQSEVIAVAQAVAGVVAVDLDLLYVDTRPESTPVPSRQVRLLAQRMHVEGGVPVADEILTLASGPFDRLEEMP